MLARLRSRWRDPLSRNITSLYVLQLASYLLPLITFPYLLRVMGPATFGVYGFILAFSRIGNIFTDWGFPYSATRDVAQGIEQGAAVDAVFSAAMWARVALLGLWCLLVAALTLWVDRFAEDASLVWISVLAVAGSAFFPLWLFQAFERLPLVIGFSLMIRVVTTGLVFVLVHSAEDVEVALWLWAAPWMATALFGLWAARSKLAVRWIRQSSAAVVGALRGSASIFVTFGAATAYTSANAVILGLVSTDTQVGYFVAAETVVLAAVGLITPLSQALFPRSSKVALGATESALRHARAALPYFAALGGVLSLAVFVSAPWIASIGFGDSYGDAVPLLRIMSGIPLAVALATVFGAHLILPLRLDRYFLWVVLGVGIASLGLAAVLVPRFASTGTALVALIAEVAIVLLLVLVTWKKRLWIFGNPVATDR